MGGSYNFDVGLATGDGKFGYSHTIIISKEKPFEENDSFMKIIRLIKSCVRRARSYYASHIQYLNA